MTAPTRADLERAAIAYFDDLTAELNQPRTFTTFEPSDELGFNLEESRRRIAEIDAQLIANTFDGRVAARAKQMVSGPYGGPFEPTDAEEMTALQLAARAEREQLLQLIHRLDTPAKQYQPYDKLFAIDHSIALKATTMPAVATVGPTLSALSLVYVRTKRDLHLVKNQVEDTTRVLKWLSEQVGSDRPVSSLSKQELRTFRDDLTKMSRLKKGQATPFAARLTSNPDDQIKSVTSGRYWSFIRAFLTWAAAEGYIDSNPAVDLVLTKRNGEQRRSPAPFTSDELQILFRSPLYAGHAHKRWSTSGDIIQRGGRWWSAVLMMFTGMRGGELAQLEPNDFAFDDAIPHVHIRPEGAAGAKAKSVKSNASVRRVPLAAVLLELGLENFVNAQRKSKLERVFDDIRLGNGRASDGLSKFWTRYLRAVGLWNEGRATHVWRHTFVASLREAGVLQEDIAAVVGHEQGTVTGSYGGAYPLSRQLKTIERLNFGFDVGEALTAPKSKSFKG